MECMSRSIAVLHVCLHLLNVGRGGLSLRQVKWNDYTMLVAGFQEWKVLVLWWHLPKQLRLSHRTGWGEVFKAGRHAQHPRTRKAFTQAMKGRPVYFQTDITTSIKSPLLYKWSQMTAICYQGDVCFTGKVSWAFGEAADLLAARWKRWKPHMLRLAYLYLIFLNFSFFISEKCAVDVMKGRGLREGRRGFLGFAMTGCLFLIDLNPRPS